MANIHNASSLEEFTQLLQELGDAELLGQQLVQKGALHAFQHILMVGCTPEKCVELVENAVKLSGITEQECRKRGLPTVSVNEAHVETDNNTPKETSKETA